MLIYDHLGGYWGLGFKKYFKESNFKANSMEKKNHCLFPSWQLCTWCYKTEQWGFLPRYFCVQSMPGLVQNLLRRLSGLGFESDSVRYFWLLIYILWGEKSLCWSSLRAVTWNKSTGLKAGLPRTPTAVGSVPVEMGVPVWEHLSVRLRYNTPAIVSMSSVQNVRVFQRE